MFSRNYLLLVAVAAMLTGACVRPLVNSNRNKGNSNLSDVSMTFLNNLPVELRKRLTHYHLNITPAATDTKCSADAKKVEETQEWKLDGNLVIKKSLTRNCTYLIKLEFGEMKDVAGVKSFNRYFANFKNSKEKEKLGDEVKTDGPTVKASVTVHITDEGIAEGLDKYLKEISSVEETDLVMEVTFGGASKLNGTFANECAPVAFSNNRWLSRSMTINGTSLTANDKVYDKAGCAAADLVSEEISNGTFQVLARAGDANPVNLTLVSKTFNPTAKFAGASHCGSNAFPVGAATSVMNLEPCKTSAGAMALFDLIDLKNDKLAFGYKGDSTVDGTAESRRPSGLGESLTKKVN